MTVDKTYYLVIESSVFEAIVTEVIDRVTCRVIVTKIDNTNTKYNSFDSILTTNYAVSTIGRIEWTNKDSNLYSNLCFIRPTIDMAFKFLITSLKSSLKSAAESKEYFEKTNNLQKLQDKL